MALEVSRDLQTFEKTLSYAGDFYLEYLLEAHKSITVESLVTDAHAMQKRLNRSQDVVLYLDHNISSLFEFFS